MAREGDAARAAGERAAEAREREAAALLRGTSREVLARLVAGDPLGFRARAGRRLRERALLLDPAAVALRAVARAAHAAPAWRGRPALEAWCARRVDDAIEDLLREEAGGRAAGGEEERALASGLGLDVERLALGRAALHALAREEREAFVRLVVEGGALDAVARELGTSAAEAARRARRALVALVGEPAPAARSRRGAPPARAPAAGARASSAKATAPAAPSVHPKAAAPAAPSVEADAPRGLAPPARASSPRRAGGREGRP